jgi:2,4-dienoyl-CoA reductase-like NADH-dependent reductase (Old Yellow Enzyme family)
LPKDRYRAYHREKARGGVGLTMMDGSALVSPDSTPVFGNLELYRDEAVPYLRALSDDVHEQGAAVMTQLTHMGHRRTTSPTTGSPRCRRAEPVSLRTARSVGSPTRET